MRPVLVDGCFDPFHPGHLHYLRAARAIAGPFRRLICKVVPDEEVATKHPVLLTLAYRQALVEPWVDEIVSRRSTVEIIRQRRPKAYVKGSDWAGRLPLSHVQACQDVGCRIRYTETAVSSSTQILRNYQRRVHQADLERFDEIAARQPRPSETIFTKEYFVQQGYTYEQRVKQEGAHPDLVARLFAGMSILDYGCGPGHFVRMLKERGMDASGYDPHVAGFQGWLGTPDVVICREVMEHVPLSQYLTTVLAAAKLARKFFYLTARFHVEPETVLSVQTADSLDPTHISMVNQAWLRSALTASGFRRVKPLEEALDHQKKGRVLVYEPSH